MLNKNENNKSNKRSIINDNNVLTFLCQYSIFNNPTIQIKMKKKTLRNILYPIIIAITFFALGYIISFLLLKEEYEKTEPIINTTLAALEAANIVIYNNELLDKDGSDEMCIYLELCAKVDSLVIE